MIRAGAAGGAALLLPGCMAMRRLRPKGQTLFIDAHAHVFNGDDVAARGFIARTVITDNEIGPLGEPFVNAIAKVLDAVVQKRAMSAREEIQLLCAELAEPDGACNVPRRPLAAPAWRNPDEGFDLDLQIALHEDAEAMDALADAPALDQTGADDIKPRFSESKFLRAFRNLASSPVRRYWKWAGYFGNRRLENARALIDLYGGEGGIDLFVAAMVDVDYWVNDVAKTEIPDLIEVTDLVSKATGRRILPFAPFCPFRDCAEGGGSLRWIQEAWKAGRMRGVKLYPPMGFLPLGNLSLDSPDGSGWPEHFRDLEKLAPDLRRRMDPGFLTAGGIAGLGAKLDRSLMALYDWCWENDVPVMAHVAPRRGAEHGYACERAGPKGWRTALSYCPELRLNLGHFGGWAPMEETVCHDEDNPNDWPDQALALMQEFPNVYADVGYASRIIFEPTKYRNDLVRMIRQGPVVKERLMYGSDWFMVANAPDHEKFKDAYQGFMEDHFAVMRDDFMGGNAARFLGIERWPSGSGQWRS